MMQFTQPASDFKAVFEDVRWHDAFYRFLQNIYRLYPEDRFHTLIKTSCSQFETDEAVHTERLASCQAPQHLLVANEQD